MPVPDRAYEMFAAGEISAEELHELEKFASDLEKVAVKLDPTTMASLGAFTVAAPALAYVGSKVPQTLQSAVNNMRFESGLKKAVEVNPALGDTQDPNLRMAYKTLQTVNPDYAKDPLISATVLDMVMANRTDPNDPSSAPKFFPADLNEIQKNVRTDIGRGTEGSVSSALSKALLD